MSDLVEFLRARLDEDDQVAQATRRNEQFVEGTDRWFATGGNAITSMAPHRAVAEVESKRRIIERHQSHSMGNCRVCEAPHWGVLVCNHCFGKAWPCPDLLDLAAVYVGHPEYLPEWAPEVP